jgi:glutathionylspermidine synthase
MDKQILSNLKTLVNHQHHFNSYLDALIEQHHKAIEQADDSITMYRTQGAIAALRRLKYLRDEVNKHNG